MHSEEVVHNSLRTVNVCVWPLCNLDSLICAMISQLTLKLNLGRYTARFVMVRMVMDQVSL